MPVPHTISQRGLDFVKGFESGISPVKTHND